MCNTNEETAHSHFTIIIDVYRNPYPPPIQNEIHSHN